MTRRQQNWFLVALLTLVPAAAVAWYWHYGPAYERAHLLQVAEKAVAANDLQKAEEALSRLTREDPNQLHTQFLHAQVLRRLGRTGEAEEALLRAVQLGLTEPEGRREYGLLEAGQDFDSARHSLVMVLVEHPDDAEVLRALADGYARKKQWREAEFYYSRLLEFGPDQLDVLAKRADLRMQDARFDEAAADLRAILQHSPTHFQARLFLAQCLMSDARMREAEAELKVCRQQRPDRAEPLVGLAVCAMEREDYELAQTLLSQALELDPRNLLALQTQSDLYLLRRRYELAIPMLQEVLRINPNDKQGHLKLAQALRYDGKADLAKQHEARYQELDREEERKTRGMR